MPKKNSSEKRSASQSQSSIKTTNIGNSPHHPGPLPQKPQPGSVIDKSNNTSRGRPLGQEHYDDHRCLPQQPLLRTLNGNVIDSNMASLKSSSFGPVLLQDYILREKIFHFDHERIPERIVHARGFGYHGVFIPNKNVDLSKISKSCLFNNQTQPIPIFLRFSTVAGNRGSSDSARDVRGTALKFYTPDGNFDIVGNNMPVFFVNDAMKFPDLIHSVKTEPSMGTPQAASAHPTFYDFVSHHPETTHTLLWAMSYRGLPHQYYHMQAFGVHTYALINNEGEKTLCKFIIKPKLGVSSLPWSTMQTISGADCDFHRKSMMQLLDFNTFDCNDNTNNDIRIPLEYDLTVQLLPDEATMMKQYHINVLDCTKYIPEELFPAYNIGTLRMQQNVVNEFAEVEQVAFCPSNIIPGIDFVNDPLLQGRLFSYLDTQLSRLGANFQKLPINIPRGICPFAKTYQQHYYDGAMQNKVLTTNTTYGPSGLPNSAQLRGAYDESRHSACPFANALPAGSTLTLPANHPPIITESTCQDDLFIQSQREKERRIDQKNKTQVHTSHLIHSTFSTLDELISNEFQEKSVGMFYRAAHPLFRDYFTQSRAYWLSLSYVERAQIAHALIFELSQFSDQKDLHHSLIHRILCQVDMSLAETVAQAMDVTIDTNDVQKYRQEWFECLAPYYNKYCEDFFGKSLSSPTAIKTVSELETSLDRNEFYVMLSMSPSLSNAPSIFHQKQQLITIQDRLLWCIQQYLKKTHPSLAAKTDDTTSGSDDCIIYPYDQLKANYPIVAKFIQQHNDIITQLQNKIDHSETTKHQENFYLGTPPPSLAYRKALIIVDKGSKIDQICAIYQELQEKLCMFVDISTSEMPMSPQVKSIKAKLSKTLGVDVPFLNNNTLSSVHYHCMIIPTGSTSWVTRCPIASKMMAEMYTAGKVIVDLSHTLDIEPDDLKKDSHSLNDKIDNMVIESETMLLGVCQFKEAYIQLQLHKKRDPQSCCASEDPLCICGANNFAAIHSLCKCNGVIRLRKCYTNDINKMLNDIIEVLASKDLYTRRQLETIELKAVPHCLHLSEGTYRHGSNYIKSNVEFQNKKNDVTTTQQVEMDSSTCNIQ